MSACVVGRQDDHRNVGQRFVDRPSGQEGAAIHDRHSQVQQDDEGADEAARQVVQRGPSIAGGDDFEALLGQRGRERATNLDVVIDDQHVTGCSGGRGHRETLGKNRPDVRRA